MQLGVKYTRLQIPEIAEKCDEPEDTIVVVAKEMIEKKEIHAEYFESTQSLVFDQTPNVEEIEALMNQYKIWEEIGVGKK